MHQDWLHNAVAKSQAQVGVSVSWVGVLKKETSTFRPRASCSFVSMWWSWSRRSQLCHMRERSDAKFLEDHTSSCDGRLVVGSSGGRNCDHGPACQQFSGCSPAAQQDQGGATSLMGRSPPPRSQTLRGMIAPLPALRLSSLRRSLRKARAPRLPPLHPEVWHAGSGLCQQAQSWRALRAFKQQPRAFLLAKKQPGQNKQPRSFLQASSRIHFIPWVTAFDLLN